MFKIDMSDIQRLVGNIEGMERQIPFVAATALTNAMKDVRQAEYDVMRSVFDSPTSFTLNSLAVRPATKTRLVTELYFKEGFGSIPAWKYLGPQIEGGPRRHKGFERVLIRAGLMRSDEFAMPGKAVAINSNGNVAGSLISQMLSALGVSTDAHQNRTAKSKRRKGSKLVTYFVHRGGKAPDGIYQRVDRTAARPIFIFTRAPNYRARYPYYQTHRRVFMPAFNRHFRDGWQRYVINDPGKRRAA